MHCCLQLVTKGRPNQDIIEQRMNPFYECDFYDKYYNAEVDEYPEIPPEEYPEFLWDYWTVWEEPSPAEYVDIGRCYTIIDRQGRAHTKSQWNGQEWVDKTKEFEYWVKRVKRELGPNDWVTTLDYHY